MTKYIRTEGDLFTLHTAHSTYQIMKDRYGVLLHLYYGKRMNGNAAHLLACYDRGTMGQIYDAREERAWSYDGLPQEYPVSGMGDMRSPALVVKNADGSEAVDLRYVSHEVLPGKYTLMGLPSLHAAEEEAETLKIVTKDEASGLTVTLLYGVFYDSDVITRSVILTNEGQEAVTLKKVLSANLDLVTGEHELLTFYGRHAMERQLQREKVSHGEKRITSRRGASSHQYNPLMILCEPHTTEKAGSCFSMEFVYSGGFLGCCEMDQIDQTRVQMGLSDEKFSRVLEQGESFTAPEVMLCFSEAGLGTLTNRIHDAVRDHVIPTKWKNAVRPVLLNSWEAFYFDFTGDDLVALAGEAADLGMDMLVLDDGWFGARNSDNAGLGDWTVNEEKLGGSLSELIDRIHGKGVKFGIWMEPEMVNEDSDLYRAHPDWALTIPGRKPVMGRNQLLLDFSRKEVVDHIFEAMCRVFDSGKVDYLKWDFNRVIVDVYSGKAADQGEVLYDFVLGVYDLLSRLNARYPELLIEGCCGGGGRYDLGMLCYTPQIWLSDNTDAIDRLRIQYGSSFGYPVSTMGAHVSAVPNEENGRMTPLHTRSVVAMAGTYGYEMDPGKLSEPEKEEIRKEVKTFKKYAALIQSGDYYRLTDPAASECVSWIIVSKDKKEALFSAVFTDHHGNGLAHFIRFAGLKSGAVYEIEGQQGEYDADILMEVGMPLPRPEKEYTAIQWHLTMR